MAPLRPLVVTLDSGTVIRRPLVGLDPAAYQSVRLSRDFDQQLLAGQARELARARALLAADSAQSLADLLALAQCRRDWAKVTDQLNAQEVRTAKALALPSQRPLLLDPNTYKGVGAGALALLLLKIFLIH